jgi:pSer/pThr/pTyr-binding forkhead associated (FHA) protein
MELDPILLKMDKLITTSRLSDIAYIIGTDITERLERITRVFESLNPGAYLIGTGPTTAGIFPLSVEEINIGRSASILEEPTEIIIDYCATDMIYFTPREVSKAHAKIIRSVTDEGYKFSLIDLGSKCGTFVNGEQVSEYEGTILSHGDVISLGASMVSTYMFYIKE